MSFARIFYFYCPSKLGDVSRGTGPAKPSQRLIMGSRKKQSCALATAIQGALLLCCRIVVTCELLPTYGATSTDTSCLQKSGALIIS
jgi:hypothetical protein